MTKSKVNPDSLNEADGDVKLDDHIAKTSKMVDPDEIDEIVLKPAKWQYDDYRMAKQQLLTLLEEEKIKGMLKMVETANCILQADEPAIDEIWFDLDMPDDSIMPMRQDTMLSELKHRLQALKQESKK